MSEVNDVRDDGLSEEEIAKLRSKEAMKYRLKNKQLTEQLESLQKEFNELKTSRDNTLGELRTIKHKDVFKSLAKELKVKDSAVNDLWTISGYKAETDDINAEAVKALIAETVKERSYFLDAETPQVVPQPERLATGQGAAKGTAANAVGFVVRRSDTMNPDWMRVNQKKFAEAQAKGEVTWVD